MNDQLSDDEVEQRATEFYEHELRSSLETTDLNSFVAIEPISRTHYLGKTLSEVGRKARTAFPNRRSFAMRVGHAAAIHIGGFDDFVALPEAEDDHAWAEASVKLAAEAFELDDWDAEAQQPSHSEVWLDNFTMVISKE